jgi:chromosomal replication initiation ATPase DnaA
MNYDDLLMLRQNTVDSLKRIDSLLSASDYKTPDLSTLTDTARMEYIIDFVCRYGSITKDQILGGRSSKGITPWKRIICYILVDFANVSVGDVMRRMDYKDHNSVFSHRNILKVWMTEPRFAPKDVHIATTNILNQLGYEKK